MSHSRRTLMIAHLAVLIALEVILSRFCSISTPLVKIGFGFVPIAIAGIMYGPKWAAAVGGMTDFIGASLFPIGAYFPGFTLSQALTGAVFGLFLHNRRTSNLHLAGAVAVNCIGISLFLTTFWVSVVSHTPYWALFPTRILQNVIMIPVQFIVLRFLQKPLALHMKRLPA